MTDNIKKALEFKVENEDQNFKRLDAFLSHKFPEHSRSIIKKFFEAGLFHSPNYKKLELKKMPPEGTIIIFDEPIPQPVDILPENIPLEILFEDDHLIILNKPAGLVVHPAPGNYTGTLVNAILHHCPNLAGIGNEKRPGIVHRLDKGTSGIMVVAKNQKTHEELVKLFSTHDIDRYYEAIVVGARIPQEKTMESIMGRSPNNRLKMSTNVKNGKKAITHLKALEFFHHFTHVELKLETGRTHQIRVHLSELLKSPILNDELYGHPNAEKNHLPSQLKALLKDYEHPLLHAKVLGFIHPITKEKLYFEKEPPKIFLESLEVLKNAK